MNQLKKELIKLNEKTREEILQDIAKAQNIETDNPIDKDEKIEKVIIKKERQEK